MGNCINENFIPEYSNIIIDNFISIIIRDYSRICINIFNTENENLDKNKLENIKIEIKQDKENFISREYVIFTCYKIFKKYYKISKKYVESRFKVDLSRF